MSGPPPAAPCDAVVIVAAGRGTRAAEGGVLPGIAKQWQPLAGAEVIDHTLAAFAHLPLCVLVLHRDELTRGARLARPGLMIVAGGTTRSQSVLAGLRALQAQARPVGRVLIHDGARPLVTRQLTDRVLAALTTSAGAAPALAVTDALWRGNDGSVTGTADREGLFRAQTPQGFRFDAILTAYGTGQDAADDVAIARAAGLDVAITEGEEENIKITWPADFARAEDILAARKDRFMVSPAIPAAAPQFDVRLGNGYDVHAFCEGDHVMICGVRIPHTKALLGHSDADVGMHALTDAIYGALAEGDIGRHFPPSDPQWKGAASEIFLAHAGSLAAARGYRIGNADVTLICERPKIGPHAAAMQAELSRILGIEAGRISVKATTSEKLGFTGREEGIAAIATATLIKG